MTLNSSSVSFSSPSNIAFVKYWGKFGRQYPMNPSISMTLSNCNTECTVNYEYSENGKGIESFLFEGNENNSFRQRLQKFLDSITDVYPIAKNLTLQIESKNTFPHSAGIASSASAMSAFCCCLVQIEKELDLLKEDFYQRVSLLSRLASGSACRSIYPNYAYWGESKISSFESTNEYALKLEKVHESFKNVCDSVLIISGEEKSVSSSQGHQLMNGHPFKESRIEQANENFRTIVSAMETGDWESFGEILELEALTLHALMMSSTPSFVLLAPNSLAVIEKIRSFREKTGHQVYFTIDAGPNIHLIYPQSIEEEVKNFIDLKLLEYCENSNVIHDHIGQGFKKLS